MGIVPLVAGHLQALYIEEIFTFFLACVKTVYECLKVSFALFSVDFYFFYDALNIQMTVKILLNQENQTLFEVQVSILQKLFSSFCTQPVPKQNRNLMCCEQTHHFQDSIHGSADIVLRTFPDSFYPPHSIH